MGVYTLAGVIRPPLNELHVGCFHPIDSVRYRDRRTRRDVVGYLQRPQASDVRRVGLPNATAPHPVPAAKPGQDTRNVDPLAPINIGEKWGYVGVFDALVVFC